MKVFIFRAFHAGRSAAVLTAIAVLFGVAAAHASITTETLEALAEASAARYGCRIRPAPSSI